MQALQYDCNEKAWKRQEHGKKLKDTVEFLPKRIFPQKTEMDSNTHDSPQIMTCEFSNSFVIFWTFSFGEVLNFDWINFQRSMSPESLAVEHSSKVGCTQLPESRYVNLAKSCLPSFDWNHLQSSVVSKQMAKSHLEGGFKDVKNGWTCKSEIFGYIYIYTIDQQLFGSWNSFWTGSFKHLNFLVFWTFLNRPNWYLKLLKPHVMKLEA